jgi:hypothetical protein
MTHVELTWVEKKIEYWIRFGRTRTNRSSTAAGVSSPSGPGTVFAFVRWAANDFGTIISRIDIVRAVEPRRALPDAALRAAGRRNPAQDRRLAEGRATCCSHRRHRARSASIRTPFRRITGGTSTTGWPPDMSRAPTRSNIIAPSSCAGGPSRERAGLILVDGARGARRRLSGLTPMPIKLMWNASASAPIGFYTIDFDGPFDVTDLVAVDAPEPLATFIAERGYLPKGVPLMKRILAVSGQTVCRSNLTDHGGRRRGGRRWNAIAPAAISPSGRAAAASRPAKSSS